MIRAIVRLGWPAGLAFAVVASMTANAAGQSGPAEHPGLAHGKRAQQLMLEQQNAEALTEWKAALRLEPGNPVYHNLCGLALQSLGRAAEARQEFRKALQTHPTYFEPRTNLAYSLMADGQLEASSTEFEHALELRPHDSALHLALGVVMTSRGNAPAACREFEAAGTLPSSPQLLWSVFAVCLNADRVDTAVKAASDLPVESGTQLAVGRSLMKANQAQRALPFLLRAKTADSPEATIALAEAYLEMGKAGEALSGLMTLSGTDRDSFAAVEIRASALLKSGQRAQAREEFEKLVKLYPEQPDSYIHATQIPLEDRHWDTALDILNAGLAKIPHQWLLLLRRAVTLKMMDRLDEAQTDLLEAVKAGGDIGLVLAALGDTTAARGDLPGAAELFRQAFEKTKLPEFQLAYALAVEKQGDEAEALREMSRAVAILPASVRAHYEYGKLLRRAGQVAAARREFERVKQLDPKYSPNLYALSRVYADIRKPELASEMAREFLASKDKAK
jgi:tetratricopeptide (TPR) repeat protein